jgi:hypothetical protein
MLRWAGKARVNESFKERNDVGHHMNVNFPNKGIGPVNDEARGVLKDSSSSISTLLPTSHNNIKNFIPTHTQTNQTKPTFNQSKMETIKVSFSSTPHQHPISFRPLPPDLWCLHC